MDIKHYIKEHESELTFDKLYIAVMLGRHSLWISKKVIKNF